MCQGLKRVIIVVVVGMILASGSISCSSSPVAEMGAPAPDFTLPTTAGSVVTLSQFHGVPVVLYLWTSWCGYCLEALGYLAVVVEEGGNQVTVIAVNVGEDASTIRQIAGEGRANFIIALDREGEVCSAYGVRYLPAIFFIDRQGILRHKEVGAFYSLEELTSRLNSFLAE
jgi:peroxiredoxin